MTTATRRAGCAAPRWPALYRSRQSTGERDGVPAGTRARMLKGTGLPMEPRTADTKLGEAGLPRTPIGCKSVPPVARPTLAA